MHAKSILSTLIIDDERRSLRRVSRSSVSNADLAIDAEHHIVIGRVVRRVCEYVFRELRLERLQHAFMYTHMIGWIVVLEEVYVVAHRSDERGELRACGARLLQLVLFELDDEYGHVAFDELDSAVEHERFPSLYIDLDEADDGQAHVV